MTTVFDTLFEADALPDLLGELGQAATYTPDGGSPVSLMAMARPVRTVEIDTAGIRTHWQNREIVIATNPASEHGGVASPAEGDAITIGGVAWTVDGIAGQTGSLARLECLRLDTQRTLTQTATYWAPGNPDSYGQRTPASPAAIAVRWEERAELFIDQAGAERRSRAVVFVASDVEVGGWLALGDHTGGDLPGGGGGSEIEDPRGMAVGLAWEIRDFAKVPTIGATAFVRKVIL